MGAAPSRAESETISPARLCMSHSCGDQTTCEYVEKTNSDGKTVAALCVSPLTGQYCNLKEWTNGSCHIQTSSTFYGPYVSAMDANAAAPADCILQDPYGVPYLTGC